MVLRSSTVTNLAASACVSGTLLPITSTLSIMYSWLTVGASVCALMLPALAKVNVATLNTPMFTSLNRQLNNE